MGADDGTVPPPCPRARVIRRARCTITAGAQWAHGRPASPPAAARCGGIGAARVQCYMEDLTSGAT